LKELKEIGEDIFYLRGLREKEGAISHAREKGAAFLVFECQSLDVKKRSAGNAPETVEVGGNENLRRSR